MKSLLAAVLIFAISACHTPQTKEPLDNSGNSVKKQASAMEQPGFTVPGSKPLTIIGYNQHARFSQDGSKIIFESSDRPSHKNSQIYILNLQTRREKRITFNDGIDTSPDFDPAGKKIIYASTTDEQKEIPDEAATDDGPGSEVYESFADGSEIKRLTNSQGFDGDCVYSRDGHHIYFSSSRDEDKGELFIMNSNGSQPHHLTTIKGHDGQVAPSPDGKSLLWTGTHPDRPGEQIYLADRNGQNIKVLTSKNAIHRDPSWSPDGKKIVFSSNRDDGTNYDLYVMNIDGTCLKRLTQTPANEVYPEFSPDGKSIVVTIKSVDNSQLFEVGYNEPKDCSADTP
jgi:TolB protein